MHHRRTLLAFLTCALALCIPARAVAFDQAAELANFSKITERQLYDSDYQQALLLQSLKNTIDAVSLVVSDPGRNPINLCSHGTLICAGDPRLYDWGDRFGVVWPVNWVNRNGAVTSGHVWAPFAKNGHVVRRASIVFFNGDLAPESLYWWLAQLLVRHGYVVMTWDPQGHGASDTLGADPDPARNVLTQTYAAAADSDQAPIDADMAEQAADAVSFFFSTPSRRYLPARIDGKPTDTARLTPPQSKQRSRVAKGLGSAFNPLYRLVDAKRFGIAGHSRGADAVSILGTKDSRVRAIVALDYLLAGDKKTGANPGLPGPPRVPALNIDSDYYLEPTPYTSAPDPQSKNAGFLAYRQAGIDAMSIAIRGGTHYEFNIAPDSPFNLATRRGIDLAGWYTLAWFDRYLRRQRSADALLRSDRWRHDPLEAAVDPTHDGSLYSSYLRSRMAIHLLPRHHGGQRRLFTCDDLRAGCPGVVAQAHDGYAGSFDYLHDRAGPQG